MAPMSPMLFYARPTVNCDSYLSTDIAAATCSAPFSPMSFLLKNTYISDSLVNLAIAAATDPKPLFLMLVQSN